MGNGMKIDVHELRQLSIALKKAAPEVQKQFVKDVTAGGQVVAERAKANASFSSRIPRSIAVRRRGVFVSIQAGGDAAPDAAPYEHRGQPGMFRHPVFGHPWTVNQQAHPFLAPAANSSIPEVVDMIGRGVNTAFRGVGL